MEKVLLKLSGEVLRGSRPEGIDHDACRKLAESIVTFAKSGVHLGIVIGGGNIIRGVNAHALGLPRTAADQMGMLSTLINGIALQCALEKAGAKARVLSALACPSVVETFVWRSAKEYFDNGEILIFVGGTGHPYFSTDSCAALRACEMGAQYFLKATKVDGIYDKDPKEFADATKYTTIPYGQVLAEKLKVIDSTSIALCRDNGVKIVVFNMNLLASSGGICVDELKKLGTVVL